MKLAKLRSGTVKLDLSPSKSLTSPPGSSITPQKKKSLRSSSKSKNSKSSRASKKLIEKLNSSTESQEKLITKKNKSAQLKSSISDNDADETKFLSKLSPNGDRSHVSSASTPGKGKVKKSKPTSTKRQRKLKRLSPVVSPKSPMLRPKLRSSKLPLSKRSSDGSSISKKKASPKKNKSPSPLKRLSNVGDRDVASTIKENLSTRDSPKKRALKEPVIRLERLSEIIKAKRSFVSSPIVKIFINDELLPDYNVNVSQDTFDVIHSPKLSEDHKTTRSSALVASTPKVNLDATLTIESEHDKEKNDDTYELPEPKTPRLRRAILESKDTKDKTLQFNIEDKSTKQSMVKKKGNVQFTSPLLQHTSRIQSAQKKLGKSRAKISPKNSRKNGVNNSVNGKVSAANNSVGTSLPLSYNSNAFFNATSPSPFASRIKTPDPKSLTKKKIPNFAQIHKKMFDKSESIIDAKKRVQDRHTALTGLENGDGPGIKTATNKLAKRSESSNVTKHGYTRYGFKLRKPEATACVLKNKIVNPRRSTEQNRAILKGVRTNRRFELQMKMRNING